MRLIEQYCAWEQEPPVDVLEIIERAGRTCYKSESQITGESAKRFVSGLLQRGHESVLEHVSASMRFVTDRGVTHEIVRHRLASYSQESTRYCNYGKAGEVQFIRPVWFEPTQPTHSPNGAPFVGSSFYEDRWRCEVDTKTLRRKWYNESGAKVKEEPYPDFEAYSLWGSIMWTVEQAYLALLQKGQSAQQARSVLPNSLKTEIVMTANLREWRHFFKLRCAPAAHPQMRDLAVMALSKFRSRVPVVFDDIEVVDAPRA